jgi:DMSO/TMAO reductase YedYZ molybdopterin-dependent catalytic subunit
MTPVMDELMQNSLPLEGDVTLIPRQETPYNAEFPIHSWWSWITPAPLFYVRSHFPVPNLESGAWRLSIEGEVERPQTLTLADIGSLPRHQHTAVLECAGNRRTEFEPCPPGVQWRDGAVSNAVWEGVRLADVLALAGPRAAAREVLLEGADQGVVAGVDQAIPFARTLPLERALHPDTLLVDRMNGSPLTPTHGAPIRVLVPGSYGMDSVKWLVRLRLLERPFEGHFQTRDYRLFPPVGAASQPQAIGPVRVNSLIAWPHGDAEVRLGGAVRVVGYAWSGAGPIRSVEITLDGGRSWQPARLIGPEAPGAWRLWEIDWEPQAPGRCVLAARAVDSTGASQPEQVEWNAKGYANNRIQWTEVQVR